MGMNGWEIIRNVEIPFAIPIIMAGIRLSTVYLIGWATLASFIGAGGLGSYIFDGLNLYLPEFIIDRKSTRLNSSHVAISYAVFCSKQKQRNMREEKYG